MRRSRSASALAVLAALVEARGRTVTKDELMARAWPGVFVEESNLTVQVAALRKAIGSAADGSGWILTVPRVGYRLLGDAGRPAVAAAGPPLLAVLPFESPGDAADGWFADGVVTDIITALNRFRSFAVIARNSSFAYRGRDQGLRDVARDLGVRYLLGGSLRRSGERLRITAQLIEARSETTLWARSFDGSPADVFAFQDRITESIATIIEPRIQAAEIALSRLERPESVAA